MKKILLAVLVILVIAVLPVSVGAAGTGSEPGTVRPLSDPGITPGG